MDKKKKFRARITTHNRKKYFNVMYPDKYKLHSWDDKPAIIWYDYFFIRAWYKNGNCHRETGPALIGRSGGLFYYYEDKPYSKENWEKKIRHIKIEKMLK